MPGRVRGREAALHLDELPVIQRMLRPSEMHLNPKVRHQLALLPRNGLVVQRATLLMRRLSGLAWLEWPPLCESSYFGLLPHKNYASYWLSVD